MKDRRKLSNIRILIALVAAGLMILTLGLQLAYFNLLTHIILCSLISIVTIALIVLDIILKEKAMIFMHSIWLIIWIVNIIGNMMS